MVPEKVSQADTSKNQCGDTSSGGPRKRRKRGGRLCGLCRTPGHRRETCTMMLDKIPREGRAAIVDLETTGLGRYGPNRDQFCSISGVLVEVKDCSLHVCKGGDGEPVTFHSLVQVTKRPSLRAVQVHRISYELAASEGRDYNDAWTSFCDWCRSHNVRMLIGHNLIGFDYPMMFAESRDPRPYLDGSVRSQGAGVGGSRIHLLRSPMFLLDTLAIARDLKAESTMWPESCSLSHLHSFFVGEELQNAHDSLADCLGLARVLTLEPFCGTIFGDRDKTFRRCALSTVEIENKRCEELHIKRERERQAKAASSVAQSVLPVTQTMATQVSADAPTGHPLPLSDDREDCLVLDRDEEVDEDCCSNTDESPDLNDIFAERDTGISLRSYQR